MDKIYDIIIHILNGVRGVLGKHKIYKPLFKKTTPPSNKLWNALLNKYVTPQGRVDYKGFLNHKEVLDVYITLLGDHPPSKNWSRNERLAYWLNAYNAFTIWLILLYYPIRNIKEIAHSIPTVDSIWELKFIKIGIADFNLETIQNKILRNKFKDPRVHFAMNYASISCPGLRNEAYEARSLEDQLEDQTIKFLKDQTKNKIEPSEVKLSCLFEKFEDDFTSKKSSLLNYIEQYIPISFEQNIPVTFYSYNWNLNDANP